MMQNALNTLSNSEHLNASFIHNFLLIIGIEEKFQAEI